MIDDYFIIDNIYGDSVQEGDTIVFEDCHWQITGQIDDLTFMGYNIDNGDVEEITLSALNTYPLLEN